MPDHTIVRRGGRSPRGTICVRQLGRRCVLRSGTNLDQESRMDNRVAKRSWAVVLLLTSCQAEPPLPTGADGVSPSAPSAASPGPRPQRGPVVTSGSDPIVCSRPVHVRTKTGSQFFGGQSLVNA